MNVYLINPSDVSFGIGIIATDSARVTRSAAWARLMSVPCRRLFAGRPMPHLQMPDLPGGSAPSPEASGPFRVIPFTTSGATRTVDGMTRTQRPLDAPEVAGGASLQKTTVT